MIVTDYNSLIKNPWIHTDLNINRGEGKVLSYSRMATN